MIACLINHLWLRLHKRLALMAGAAAAIGLPVAVGVIGAPQVTAQSQSRLATNTPRPRFGDVKIRQCDAFRSRSPRDLSPGTLHTECTSLERLVEQAYGLYADGHMHPLSSLTVVGGPQWINTALYEIDAKAADGQSQPAMNGPMLQAVLEDRFKLRFHRESRPVPVYELTRAPGGPELRPFEGHCTPWDFDHPNPGPSQCGASQLTSDGFTMQGAAIADVRMFLLVTLGRPVLDKTDMSGRFDFHVEMPTEEFQRRPWTVRALSDPAAQPASDTLTSAIKAGIQKSGLVLKPAQGSGDFIIIDDAGKPSLDQARRVGAPLR